MTIIKDANYWKEYNQKRKEYMKNLMRATRAQAKVANNNSQIPVANKTLVANIPEIVANITEEIKVANTVANSQESKMVANKVVDKNLDKVVDLEVYNAEVYKRASVLTKDPEAFFTFPDGRKIIRTICGCNLKPNQDPKEWFNYTWCLDNCEYFTGWRNKAINYEP